MEQVDKLREYFLKEMNWRQVYKEFSGVAPYLMPFFKCLCIYYILWLSEDTPTIAYMTVKCLPVLCLVSFVFFQGLSNSYNCKIFAGLCCACAGDAFLAWQHAYEELFILGMLSFAIAMCMYISAFGFSTFGTKSCLLAFVITLINYAIFVPRMLHYSILLYGVCVYILLLGIMGWRVMVAASSQKGGVSWRRIYAVAGVTLFIISDFALGFNKFIQPIAFQRFLIMTPYYAGQLLITLSVVNSNIFMNHASVADKKQQ